MVVGFSWNLNLWVLGILFPEVQVDKGPSLSFAFVYCQGLESMGVPSVLMCHCSYAQEAAMSIHI